jgi:thiosulfate dehydrogenase
MKSIVVLCLLVVVVSATVFLSCQTSAKENKEAVAHSNAARFITIDTSQIPNGQFGEAVRYGRQLMLNTAYYIGPEGVNGRYLGNKMNCTNCHQDAGTKPFSFCLISSQDEYPQYRAREGKVLTLAERVNNCVTHPHNGKPLPLDSKEMVAFLAYFKWINGYVSKGEKFKGSKNLQVTFPATAASPERGAQLYVQHCARCHGNEGEGVFTADKKTYTYPPLWGANGYQPGSSMHRVIKMSQWLKANMPYDKATWNKPFLTDAEALDIAAFVNNDNLHKRPHVNDFEYPRYEEKSIDYDRTPFADTFSVAQHKYGPYQPIIDYLQAKGKKAVY